MRYLADGDGDLVAVNLVDRHMLLVGRIGGAGENLLHHFAAAVYGNAAVADHSDNIAAMMDGSLDFLVGQRPGLQGFLAVETLLKNIICGGHPEVENYMPLDIITRENIDYYKEYVVQNSTGGVEGDLKMEK